MTTDLAKRLAAHPKFTWVPGMLHVSNVADHNGRVLHIGLDGAMKMIAGCTPGPWAGRSGIQSAWPDLSDPATAGCLLAMVRELDPGIVIECSPGHVSLIDCGAEGSTEGSTLGEACALRLLRGWGEP